MFRNACQQCQCLSANLWIARLAAVSASAFIAFSCFVPSAKSESTAEDVGRAQQLLTRAGVTPNAAGAVRFLNQLRPATQLQETVADLIEQLGHDDGFAREEATRALERLGITAEAQLMATLKSTDLEIALRARHLLQLIRQARDSTRHDAMLSAALLILSRQQHEDGAETILRTIPLLESESHFEQACVALWFTTTPDDLDRIRQAIQQGNDRLRTAAIPALEVAGGAKAIADLRPFLSHESDRIRLAAVRALLDRLPLECVSVLTGLLDSDNSTVKFRAAWLLTQVFGERAEEDMGLEFSAQVNVWKQRASKLEASDLNIPLDAKRLRLSQYRAVFREDFTREIASIEDRYGKLRYETTVAGARASASDGIARLHGDHNEGDQRLFITTRQLVGKEQLTSPFVVVAEIGGEALGSGTYHVGISVGNLRILFHPGYHQGGFRIERVDNHSYLVRNQSMPFTPAPGILHKVRVSVTPQKDKSVLLKAHVINGQNPSQKYENNYLAAAADIGPINRVALERSGRVGGAALFGSFEVDTTGVDR